MSKRLLVMAGGTGGHIFPGLAVADTLHQQGWDIHWLGTPKRMEAQLIPKTGYPLHFVHIEGVRGNGLFRLLKAPFMLLNALYQAWRIFSQIKPDVVLGMGGFASGPGGIVSWLRRVPLIIHEQNAVAGATNKMLAPLASKVLTGFADTFAEKYQPLWVGNPVRTDIVSIGNRERYAQSPCRILVIGGSLGARILNQTLPEVIRHYGTKVSVRHQCGAGNQAEVITAYQQAGNTRNVQVDDFIDDMAAAYQWADLVICRAGALTVAEVALAGVAAIFVPLPGAVDDHQTRNAQALVNAGAALIVAQQDNFSSALQQAISSLVDDAPRCRHMATAGQSVARPHATQDVANQCKLVAGEKQNL